MFNFNFFISTLIIFSISIVFYLIIDKKISSCLKSKKSKNKWKKDNSFYKHFISIFSPFFIVSGVIIFYDKITLINTANWLNLMTKFVVLITSFLTSINSIILLKLSLKNLELNYKIKSKN